MSCTLRHRSRKGNFLIETAMMLPLLFTLAAGTFALGNNLDRYLQVQQLSRYTVHIAQNDPAFETAAIEQLVRRAAAGTELSMFKGNSVVYVSRIVVATGGANRGKPVVMYRHAVGNPETGPSRIATPARTRPDGRVSNFEDDPAAHAQLDGMEPLPEGATLFAAEVVHRARDLSVPSLFRSPVLYAKSIF